MAVVLLPAVERSPAVLWVNTVCSGLLAGVGVLLTAVGRVGRPEIAPLAARAPQEQLLYPGLDLRRVLTASQHLRGAFGLGLGPGTWSQEEEINTPNY